jgi:hypothetical protein
MGSRSACVVHLNSPFSGRTEEGRGGVLASGLASAGIPSDTFALRSPKRFAFAPNVPNLMQSRSRDSQLLPFKLVQLGEASHDVCPLTPLGCMDLGGHDGILAHATYWRNDVHDVHDVLRPCVAAGCKAPC